MNGTKKTILALLLVIGGMSVFAANDGYENGNTASVTIDGVVYDGYADTSTKSAKPTAAEALTMKYARCSSLKTLDLSSVGAIGDAAFAYTAISSLFIPRNVTSVGYISFGGCDNLKSVTIESWNWAIGTDKLDMKRPFAECKALTTLVVTEDAVFPPSFDISSVFENLERVVCPEWCVSDWLLAYEGLEVVVDENSSPCDTYLRLHSFYGWTSGADGDEGEWFMLTNISEQVDLEVEGVTVTFAATGETEETAQCKYTVPEGMVVTSPTYLRIPCTIFKIEEVFGDDAPAIPNGSVTIYVRSPEGRLCQTLSVDPSAFPTAKGGGDHLVCLSVEKEVVGDEYWKAESPDGSIFLSTGDYSAVFTAADQAEADAIVSSRVNIVLSDEDVASGLEAKYVKAFAVAVSGQPGVYQAYVGVNEETVPVPEIGDDDASPMQITTTSSGSSVGITVANAVKGLWYGCQVKSSLTDPFENDVSSFKRAESDGAVVISCSERTGGSAFFRVVVTASPPTE